MKERGLLDWSISDEDWSRSQEELEQARTVNDKDVSHYHHGHSRMMLNWQEASKFKNKNENNDFLTLTLFNRLHTEEIGTVYASE